MNQLDNASPHSPGRTFDRIAWAGVLLVFALLAWRQHAFVDRYAVNILFWDQWDFYAPLFKDGSLWDVFNQQHGPHRQGIGFVLTAALAHLTDWNSRADAFGVSLILMAGAACAIWLGRRCGARILTLAAVPFLFLNLRQYEMFVNASNISHGAMPVLLLVLLSLTWFVRDPRWRYALLALLTFFAIFTGFALFAGAIVPCVVLLEVIQLWRAGSRAEALFAATSLLVIALSWVLFSRGYRFDPAVSGYEFPVAKPVRYLYFMAGMANNYHGLDTRPFAWVYVGILFIGVLFALSCWHGYRLIRHGARQEPRSATILLLASFTLVYAFETGVGRVVLGWHEASAASRYVTLITPGALAVLLHLASLRHTAAALGSALAYALVVAAGTWSLHADDMASIDRFSGGKRAWAKAYLATHDEAKATALADFPIYPAPVLDDRLKYLERHRLNLFRKDNAH